MAILKQGILGGFSGKVGNVVGASWKGIDYIRSLPSSVSNPRTPGQVSQRTKFSLVQGFLTSMQSAVRIGFKNYAGKQTAFNAATSYNLRNGIIGEGSNIKLDFPNLKVSKGKLYPSPSGDALVYNDELIFEWNNSRGSNGSEYDKVIMVVFNEVLNESVVRFPQTERMDGEDRIIIPLHWLGHKVHCYLTFTSPDEKMISDSTYFGAVDIPTEI